MRSKILYGLYFLIWTIFFVLAISYFTDNYYRLALIFGHVVGLFTLTVFVGTLLTIFLIHIFKPSIRNKTKRTFIICLTPLVLLIPLVVFYFLPNKIENIKQTIKVSHIDWACQCADWATLSDIKKSQDTGNLEDYCFFIEPVNKNLELPDTIGYSGDIIELTGQFYVNKGFPKKYNNSEGADKARVFRYTSYKVIESNYRATIDSIYSMN